MGKKIKVDRRDSATLDKNASISEADIDQMVAGIEESKKNLNSVVALVEALESKQDPIKIKAIRACCRVFTRFLADGSMDGKQAKHKTQKTLAEWLEQNYKTHLTVLLSLLKGNHKENVEIAAMRALMEYIRVESETESKIEKHYAFEADLMSRFIDALLSRQRGSSGSLALNAFMAHYVAQYDDVRFFFLRCVARLCLERKESIEPTSGKKRQRDNADLDAFIANGFEAMMQIVSLPTTQEEIDTFFCDNMSYCIESTPISQLRQHQRVFSDAWLALMKLPLTMTMYKQLLTVLHEQIIPNMADPRLLHDFLTDSYNQGGAISLLALNSLFYLIHNHNLDYPDFFKKLYALFDRNMLHLKYRARFLKLATLFLRSTHLPAYLVAAFVKRAARLCLFAPPAAIMSILPWIHNLMRYHPTCQQLLHRELNKDQVLITGTVETNEQPCEKTDVDVKCASDVFNFDESDPAKCKAIDSSLWELQALKTHYYPEVSKFVQAFSRPYERKQFPFQVQDFLDRTYDTFIQEELSRTFKKTPALDHETKPDTSIFSPFMAQYWEL